MTPEERLEYLLAEVWQPTNKAITVAEIVDAVGLDAARLVVGTLQAAAAQDPILAASFQALTTVGMSLSSPDRQGLIDQLATTGYGPEGNQPWPTTICDGVKALGGVWRVRWQVEGYQAAPTLSALTKQQMIENTRSRINAKATAVNAWLDAIDLEAYDEPQLQEYCDSLLASADGNPVAGAD